MDILKMLVAQIKGTILMGKKKVSFRAWLMVNLLACLSNAEEGFMELFKESEAAQKGLKILSDLLGTSNNSTDVTNIVSRIEKIEADINDIDESLVTVHNSLDKLEGKPIKTQVQNKPKPPIS